MGPTQFSDHPEWQDWMKHWLFTDETGKYFTYDPGNDCLYEGYDLTSAIRSFKISTFE